MFTAVFDLQAIPLAVLTQDVARLGQLRAMIDHILTAAATPAGVYGWLGPASGRGRWAAARGATALAQWADATGDERVVPALAAFASQLAHQLGAHPLNAGSPGEGTWAGARWVEYVAVFEWLLDQQRLTYVTVWLQNSPFDCFELAVAPCVSMHSHRVPSSPARA